MDFVSFARLHGVVLDALPPFGRWCRYPTEDHPRTRNGAVKFMGDHGFVQNHATMTTVEMWQPDRDAPQIDMAALNRQVEEQRKKREHEADVAQKKAGWILHQTTLATHEYLGAKGFPLEKGNVWMRTDAKTGDVAKLLCIPMRVCGAVVGLQMIAPDGNKRFLMGQRTADAVFVFDNKGPTILAEGYATALSVRKAMQNMRQRYRIEVCFSAGNIAKRAKANPDAFIVADNDLPSVNAPEPGGMGRKVAIESGLQFWLSDRAPEDFNDFSMRLGEFRAVESLRKQMRTP